jgi:hypothetical protein
LRLADGSRATRVLAQAKRKLAGAFAAQAGTRRGKLKRLPLELTVHSRSRDALLASG